MENQKFQLLTQNNLHRVTGGKMVIDFYDHNRPGGPSIDIGTTSEDGQYPWGKPRR